MLQEAIAKWLDADANLPYPVHYNNIPQNSTTRPAIVVEPNSMYDHGNTAKLPVPQKLVRFCIRVVAQNMSALSTPRDLLVAKLEAISGSLTPTTIGAFRCQAILVEDIVSDSVIYGKNVDDRRQAGAPEQDFCYCDIFCLGSYHRTIP
jgi:hypothetical protein